MYFCNMIRVIQSLFIFLLLATASYAGNISKGFEALKQYNYFEAKKVFTKYLKKEPAAANFGLATIYFRNDNPFHSLDSAYITVNLAEKAFATTSDKSKEKLKKYGFDYLAIAELRSQISNAMFQLELKSLNEASLDAFQRNHPWAQERFTAIELRDSLGYVVAEKAGTSAGFSEFMKKYPESLLKVKAQQEFYRLQYRERTSAGTLSSYMSFETACPENPYVRDAQDQIFALSTKTNQIADYVAFIKRFPGNRNIEQAWRKLYQLYMVDFSAERLEKFKSEYPNYPFMQELERDQTLSATLFLPYKKNGMFGWIDVDGNILIPAQYASVGFFKDGLAWAEKSGKYGFINKANEVIIPFQFESVTDFEKGRAIVESNGLYGCIDRSGAFIVPVQFKDLGLLSEDLMYAQKDSLYGYYDAFGFQRIAPQFDEAYSFENGKSKVVYQGLTGFIDPYGSFIVKPLYEEIISFSDSLFLIEEGDFFQFVKRKTQTILPLKADAVGKLVNDRAVVEFDGKVGYVNAAGTVVIPFQYEAYTNARLLGTFNGNYAKAASKGKYGVIDRAGKAVIPFQYPKMGAVGSLIAVEKNGKWGFIDLANQMQIPPTYEFAESFVDGLGFVQNMTLFGAINSKNQVVIPLQYTTISKLDKNHYAVTVGAKNGIYNAAGKLVVPAEYNRMQKINDDLYALFKGTELHYFQVSTDKLIIPQIPE